MSAQHLFRLEATSVVVTAGFHNPSILNPDFLRAQEIVPEDWEAIQVLTTPNFSTTQYKNGIRWEVDPNKLTITESCNASFQEEYRVHELICKYINQLPHVPYHSLGLNCNVIMSQEKPGLWLTERFLKTGKWTEREPKISSMLPIFSADADDAVCHFAINIPTPQGESAKIIEVDCNMHHSGPLKVPELRKFIKRWPERQQFIINALNNLLGQLEQ